MADFHIGLDFGTSQTKICLLKIGETHTREFIKFLNKTYFLPSLITKLNNKFYYGNEDIDGIKYRFFKMAAVEDQEIINATFEGGDNNFRVYNKNFDYTPEILCILYLAYCYKYVQDITLKNTPKPIIGNKLSKLLGDDIKGDNVNSFSIKLGIPTDWNAHHNINRKIKFQSILLIAYKLAHSFNHLNDFLNSECEVLIDKINLINKELLRHSDQIDNLLDELKLSVYPETAAGLSYLLEKKVFGNGYYAVMDIGAGTTDVSVIRIFDNQLKNYLCSESVIVASNNVYKTYLENIGVTDITFDQIKEIADVYKSKKIKKNEFKATLEESHLALSNAFKKMFHQKYFIPTRDHYNDVEIPKYTRKALNGKTIVLYGGGSNFDIINSNQYIFYKQVLTQRDMIFSVKPNINQLTQIQNDAQIFSNDELKRDYKLLILALGLSVVTVSDERNLFYNLDDLIIDNDNNNELNYYDIQDAVYK